MTKRSSARFTKVRRAESCSFCDSRWCGTFTGCLANFFLAPPKKASMAEMSPAEVDVRSKVAELRELIAEQQAQQQAATDEIEGLLASDGTAR